MTHSTRAILGPPATPGLNAATLCEAFQLTSDTYPDRTAIRTSDNGLTITWAEYARRVRTISAGLAAFGIRPGDSIGIMLRNRPEFHLVDTATMHLGAVPVSIYNTSPVEQVAYVVRNAGCRLVFTESEFLETVLSACKADTGVVHVVVVEPTGAEVTPTGTEVEVVRIDEIEAAGDEDFDFDGSWRSVGEGDLATLIYTSGTTGAPKGVQLTHGNLMNEWRSLQEVFQLQPAGRIISWMPAAHIADRLLVQYQQMIFGHTVTCCPDPKQLIKILPEVRPTFWVAVPHLWQKLQSFIQSEIDTEVDDGRRQKMRAGVEVGLRYVRTVESGLTVDAALEAERATADRDVFGPIRHRLGIDQAEVHVCGASPVPYEVLEFFHAIGVPVVEAWGMSELPIATIGRPGDARVGTVGSAVPGVELDLADDGEILLRGPQVFVGYKDEPAKTAETLDSKGWLHTGDVGSFDQEGYLRIVDRKKELIINSSGKNMAPSKIEARLRASSALISQAVCVGDNRPYNVALVVPDSDGVTAFARRHSLAGQGIAQLCANSAVQEEITAAVREANAHLARVEQIKAFKLLSEEWQPGGDELTASSKLRRKAIDAKYEDQITDLYDS